MNHAIVCPECHARLRDEFIRCPVCHAFVVDSSPWRSDNHLYAIPITLLLWWVIDLVLRLRDVVIPLGGKALNLGTMPTADILQDPISRFILALGIYAMVLLFFKWRVTRRQVLAFQEVRAACAVHHNQLGDATLLAARERIGAARLGPFNTFIAYHRLQWLLASRHSDREGRLELLEAQRAHAATDWDSLESAFSSIQYLVWLLPTTGFLGTVWGMTVALQSFSTMIGSTKSDLSFTNGLIGTAQGLGTAFHTTVVGLALVIPVLAVATLLRRNAQNFLERADKYFVRMAATLVDDKPLPLATPVAPPPTAAPLAVPPPAAPPVPPPPLPTALPPLPAVATPPPVPPVLVAVVPPPPPPAPPSAPVAQPIAAMDPVPAMPAVAEMPPLAASVPEGTTGTSGTAGTATTPAPAAMTAPEPAAPAPPPVPEVPHTSRQPVAVPMPSAPLRPVPLPLPKPVATAPLAPVSISSMATPVPLPKPPPSMPVAPPPAASAPVAAADELTQGVLPLTHSETPTTKEYGLTRPAPPAAAPGAGAVAPAKGALLEPPAAPAPAAPVTPST